jgi:hypothetical protein
MVFSYKSGLFDVPGVEGKHAHEKFMMATILVRFNLNLLEDEQLK